MARNLPNENSSRRPLTPLWIIALFVSLTETIVGLAVTRSSGAVQLSLTIFSIAFPALVAGAFFLILWHRPHVFYSPSEFQGRDVAQYVDAMLRRRPAEGTQMYDMIRESVQSALASQETVDLLTKSLTPGAANSKAKVVKALESIAATTVQKIDDSNFLVVDLTPLGEPRQPRFAYVPRQQVNHFLDTVYFAINEISQVVPPYTYEDLWTLRDHKTGKVFKDIGRDWARSKGLKEDTRLLSEVGIFPGMLLEAIPLKSMLPHYA